MPHTSLVPPSPPPPPRPSQPLALAPGAAPPPPPPPSWFAPGAAPPDGERVLRHVLRDRAARRHVGALTDDHGGDERRVAADERSRLDPGGGLLGAVGVAGGPAP